MLTLLSRLISGKVGSLESQVEGVIATVATLRNRAQQVKEGKLTLIETLASEVKDVQNLIARLPHIQ